MGESTESEALMYDQFDRRQSSSRNRLNSFIQIDIPSSRIEVPSDHVLFKKNETEDGGKIEEVKAKNIKKDNLLVVIRDNVQFTERVLEVKIVSKNVPDGIILVNNIPMKHNK